MKAKDNVARLFGGTAGTALALTLPHIGCLGALTAAAIAAGFDAAAAQTVAVAGGGTALLVAGGAAAYGATPARTHCAAHRRCARRGVAMALAGFVLASGFNTLADRGIPGNDRTAAYLEWAHSQGRSVWTALNDICYGGPQ